MTRWHPWRRARDLHPDITIDCTRRLPAGTMGLIGEQTVWIHRGLTQTERRCTLTHELMHIEMPDADEETIERETARRLITLPQLVDAFRWLRHPSLPELAEHLWVDQQTAWTRMQNLDPIEVAEIEAATEGDWSWSEVA
ncbi:metalloprotease [Gordonia phage LonelyBoi]|nr:metalloprotease [Gordonia phage LonelyBoi]